MIVTTTDRIQGRKIKHYLGLVSSRDFINNQEISVDQAIECCQVEIAEKALSLGADAVIGTQISLAPKGGEYRLSVVITGTAVKLK